MGISRRIDIKVGFQCNNHCKFCVQGGKREKFPEKRPLAEIKDNLQKNVNWAEGIVFTGGEPTLRLEELVEMARYGKKLGYKVIQVQTNGRLFAYLDFCKALIKAGVTEFSPALHGHNAKIHDFLTSSKGSFKETVQGIRNLKALGQYVLTNTVITTRNYKFLPEIALLLVGLDVDQFQFAFPHIAGTAEKNKDWLIPDVSRIMKYVKRGLDIGIKAGKRVMTEAIPYCLMPSGYERYIAEQVMPNAIIYDADLEISDYAKYRKEEAKAKRGACRQCRYDSVCEGPWKEYPVLKGWSEFRPVKQR